MYKNKGSKVLEENMVNFFYNLRIGKVSLIMTETLKAMFSPGDLTGEGPACKLLHVDGRIHAGAFFNTSNRAPASIVSSL